MFKKTIEQFVEASEQYDAGKHDHLSYLEELSMNQDGTLVVPPTIMGSVQPLTLEERACRQLVNKSAPGLYPNEKRGSLPFEHHWQLLKQYPDLFADQFNRFWNVMSSNGDNRKWLVRAHEGNARAILSDRYADTPNTELLGMAATALNDVDYTLGYSHVSRDDMIVRVIVKGLRHPITGDDSGFGFGFMIRNDEIGGGAAQVCPVLQRFACTNSIIAIQDENGQTLGVRLVHSGSAKMKMAMLAGAIAEVLPHAEKMLDKYADAMVANIPALPKLIANLGEKYKWSEETTQAVNIGTNGWMSQAGLVNGLTFAAQSIENNAERLRMEQLGGEMLFTAAAKLVAMSEGAPIPVLPVEYQEE